MARVGDVQINLGEDTREFISYLTGTRLFRCGAIDCEYHAQNDAMHHDEWTCTLKQISIESNGGCGKYAPKN